MVNFICSNDYQVLQAALYCKEFRQPVCIFVLSDQDNLYTAIEDITFIYVQKNILDIPLKQLTSATESDLLLLNVIYDDDSELHVFENIEQLYNKGRDNVILHDNGDSSYIINEYGMPGQLDPYTVSSTLYKQSIEDFRNEIFECDINKYKEELLPIFSNVKGIDATIDSNTILFVHNVPDEKYTEEEKQELYKELELLLQDIKKAGYKIHFKQHHKRKDTYPIEKIADVIISDIPIELIPNIEQYKYVVSVRNNFLQHINSDNVINALTQQAVTKCKKNWKYVYSRGIFKIRKQLNLIDL